MGLRSDLATGVARGMHWLAIAAIVITVLITFSSGITSCQEREARQLAEIRAERERERLNNPVSTVQDFQSGDCVPFRAIEMRDGTMFAIIGDYRQKDHVVMQRFIDGWRVVHPAASAQPKPMIDKGMLERLER